MDTSGRCCLLSTSRGRPVHLWDAVSGTLRASYVGFNHLDEVDAANSVVAINERRAVKPVINHS